MNNTALAGIIVGAVALAGTGAILANSGYNPLQKYATVVSVEPAFDVTRMPRQVCGGEPTASTAQTDCYVVYETHTEQAGFDVTYELDGIQKVVRMDRDPGARIPVEDGELVVSLR